MSQLRTTQIAVTTMLLLGTIAAAHPGHFGSAFHAHSITEAQQIAEAESKLILLYVGPVESRGWSHLHAHTSAGRPLLDLLVRETVIVELTVGAPELIAPRFDGIQAPRVLLLNADGTERNRFSADQSVATCVSILEKEFSGHEAIKRVESAKRSLGEDHFFTRERWACVLARSGQFPQAIAEFDACIDVVLRGDDVAARSRRVCVFRAFGDLALEYAPARSALDSTRSVIEMTIADEDDASLANDWAELNRRLGEPERTLALFDRLPADRQARHGMLDFIFDFLIEQGRYEDLRSLVRPLEAMDGELEAYRRLRVVRPASAEQGADRGSRRFVVERGLDLIEIAAGTRDDNDARILIETLLDFDADPQLRDRIMSRVKRTGNQALVDLDRTAVAQ